MANGLVTFLLRRVSSYYGIYADNGVPADNAGYPPPERTAFTAVSKKL